MKKKEYNLLVVEDNEKYRDEAKKLLTNYQKKTKRKLNILFGKDYDEGRQILENEKIDFGLYDIFLPSKDKKLMRNLVNLLIDEYAMESDSESSVGHTPEQYIDALNETLKNGQAPLGIILSHLSNICNVLNVNVTDKFHHNISMNPVCEEERWTIRLPMIDSKDKGYNKGWKRAMAYLASFKFGDETCVPVDSYSKKPEDDLTLKFYYDYFKDKEKLDKKELDIKTYISGSFEKPTLWEYTHTNLRYKVKCGKKRHPTFCDILKSDIQKTHMGGCPYEYRLLNFTEGVNPKTLKALNKIDKIILNKLEIS